MEKQLIQLKSQKSTSLCAMKLLLLRDLACDLFEGIFNGKVPRNWFLDLMIVQVSMVSWFCRFHGVTGF